MLTYYTQSKMLSACPLVEINMTCSRCPITTFTDLFLAALSTNDLSAQLHCLPRFAHGLQLKSVIDRGVKSRTLLTKCTTTVAGTQATLTCASCLTEMGSVLSSLKITWQICNVRVGDATVRLPPSFLVRSPYPISAGHSTTLSVSTTSI